MARITPRTVKLRDGTDVLLRSAEPADSASMLDYLDDLDRTSEHTVTLPHERAPTVEKQSTRTTELTDSPNSVCIVAMLGDRVIGEISFKGHPRQRMAHHGHFGLGVRSEWRGRGVGEQLIRALLDWARENPMVEKVCLGVFADNHRAIALYRRLGFVEEGRREKEFKLGPGRYCDDIQMSLWVKDPARPAPPGA